MKSLRRLRSITPLQPRARLRARAANGTFVERLLARYARRRGVQRGLELLFASTPPTFVSYTLRRYGVETTFSPILLQAQPNGERASREPRARPSAATIVRQFERRIATQTERLTKATDIVRQFHRTEVSVRATPAALRPDTLASTPSVSDETLTRSMPVATRASTPATASHDPPHPASAREPADAPDVRPSTGADRRRQSAPADPARGGFAERDIDRVTERVMQSIDRRLVAHRERLGRP